MNLSPKIRISAPPPLVNLSTKPRNRAKKKKKGQKKKDPVLCAVLLWSVVISSPTRYDSSRKEISKIEDKRELGVPPAVELVVEVLSSGSKRYFRSLKIAALCCGGIIIIDHDLSPPSHSLPVGRRSSLDVLEAPRDTR